MPRFYDKQAKDVKRRRDTLHEPGLTNSNISKLGRCGGGRWGGGGQQTVHACLPSTDLPLLSLEIYIHKLNPFWNGIEGICEH